jgi:large subunit ribosomal protein L6
MSRIGKLPISLGDKVKVELTPRMAKIQGSKGSLCVSLPVGVKVVQLGTDLLVTPDFDSLEGNRVGVSPLALHGLCRTLLANAVHGVRDGFTRVLELNGVGYRASVSGKFLELTLGYSHPIKYEIPEGIEIKVDKQTVVSVLGADKALVGLVASQIRGFRPPEPYLGKGVKYQGEKIRRKAGKSGGK